MVRKLANRIAQAAAKMVENEYVLLGSVVFFAAYFVWNCLAPKTWRFDPWPFPFICMAVSVGAIFLLLALGVAVKNKE